MPSSLFYGSNIYEELAQTLRAELSVEHLSRYVRGCSSRINQIRLLNIEFFAELHIRNGSVDCYFGLLFNR